MNIVESFELPEHSLSCLIEIRGGQFYVHASDKGESWATTPFESIDDAWSYIKDWLRERGISR